MHRCLRRAVLLPRWSDAGQVDFLDFRFALLDDDAVTEDNFENLSGKLPVLGSNFRPGTLEVLPQAEALLLGRGLGLGVKVTNLICFSSSLTVRQNKLGSYLIFKNISLL